MKPLFGPIARYCWTPGNRGVTGFAIIETSHVAVHIWDEPNPAVVQFDVYTCGEFNPDMILKHLDEMAPVKMEYKWLDREKDLTEIKHYNRSTNESNNSTSNSKT
jgi:S-adenosylmethionine/arginine decarboxylase-like enzyme